MLDASASNYASIIYTGIAVITRNPIGLQTHYILSQS